MYWVCFSCILFWSNKICIYWKKKEKKEDGQFRSCKWAHTSPKWQILGSGLFCKYLKISDESTAEIGFLKRKTGSDLDLRTHIDEKNGKLATLRHTQNTIAPTFSAYSLTWYDSFYQFSRSGNSVAKFSHVIYTWCINWLQPDMMVRHSYTCIICIRKWCNQNDD